MDVRFFPSKDGNQTCTINSFFLHSSYSPLKEAERFSSSINLSFNPSHIFIISPGLPYITDFLRRKFPGCKIHAIQFVSSFSDYDNYWDSVFVFDCFSQKTDDFNYYLNSRIASEEDVFTSAFLSWAPSEKIFPDLYSNVWILIKSYVNRSRDIFGTRCFFNKKWLENTLFTLLNIQKTYSIKKIDKAIVIAASGPDLSSSFDTLRQKRDSFFLLALSSAIEPLLFNNIIPDLCLTTDGGYWATRHFDVLLRNKAFNIPIAAPAESLLPLKILNSNPIIPLIYGDGLETIFSSKIGLFTTNAKRNGTVSGTAVSFALSLTNKPIFFTGLDLFAATGFQHTQPNSLEESASCNDYRLKNSFTRLTSSELNSNSLSVYRNWFDLQKDFHQKVFRISSGNSPSLSCIEDINLLQFANMLQFSDKKNEAYFYETKLPNQQQRLKIILDLLVTSKQMILENPLNPLNEIWYTSCALSEFTVFKRHSSSDNSNTQLRHELVDKTVSFIETLQKKINKRL